MFWIKAVQPLGCFSLGVWTTVIGRDIPLGHPVAQWAIVATTLLIVVASFVKTEPVS